VGDLASAADAFDATSTAPPGTLAAAADKFDSIKPESAPAQSKQATNTPTPADPNAAAYVYRTPTHGRGTQTNPMAPTEAATSSLTSGGASILGGFTGLGTAIGQMSADSRDALKGLVTGDTTAVKSILSGKSLANAREQGGAAASQFQEEHAWQPTSPDAANMVRISNMPGAAMGKAADYAGQAASDITGSPTVGAGVKTAVSMLPAIALHKATEGGKAAPVERPVPPPGVTAPAAEAATAASAPAPAQAMPGAAPAVSAPVASPAPAVPPIAPEITVPRGTVAPISAETPTEHMPPGQTIPVAAQADRAKVLQDVGFQDARQAAIEGDNRTRAVEYQMSKFDEPAGQAAAKQFAGEQQVMGDHVRGLISDAGGTEGLDQDSLYDRGKTIVQPVQALQNWFDSKASELYKAADAKAAGQPVTLGTFGDTVRDPSYATNPDRVLMKDAVLSFAKKAGMQIGEDGSITGTALQSETVRKWLNQERTNSNGGFVDAMKDSMDDDVAASAGGPIHDQARALWTLRQQTLADPKGISSLLESDGPNRTVPYNKIPGNITKMDPDQFGHIVQTLRNLPPDIQPVGNQAIGEIKAQYYNQMLKDATETRGGNVRPFWNGTAVKNVISNNSRNLATVMSPEELGKIDTLRKAGDILSFDPGYPGAAAQAQNAVKHGLMSSMIKKGLTGAGAAAGGFLGGPIGAATGAALGDVAGSGAASAIGEKQALKRWGAKSIPLGSPIYNENMSTIPK
jgi:hypothetical protein